MEFNSGFKGLNSNMKLDYKQIVNRSDAIEFENICKMEIERYINWKVVWRKPRKISGTRNSNQSLQELTKQSYWVLLCVKH